VQLNSTQPAAMPTTGSRVTSAASDPRPPCVCGCGRPADGSSIYAVWACRARSKARRTPAPRPSPEELRRRLEAARIRQGPKPLAPMGTKPSAPLVRVIRTRDLGPAGRTEAPAPPPASRTRPPQGGPRPLCRCGCGRPPSANSGVYAFPSCRKGMRRTRGQERRSTGTSGQNGGTR
jgi:hypothetical protein